MRILKSTIWTQSVKLKINKKFYLLNNFNYILDLVLTKNIENFLVMESIEKDWSELEAELSKFQVKNHFDHWWQLGAIL